MKNDSFSFANIVEFDEKNIQNDTLDYTNYDKFDKNIIQNDTFVFSEDMGITHRKIWRISDRFPPPGNIL